jgi:hypothetical protein
MHLHAITRAHAVPSHNTVDMCAPSYAARSSQPRVHRLRICRVWGALHAHRATHGHCDVPGIAAVADAPTLAMFAGGVVWYMEEGTYSQRGYIEEEI